MNKSKHIFLILGALYFSVAVGGKIGVFTINENVLLGLSLASLFVSTSDICIAAIDCFVLENGFNYSLKFASDYLNRIIQKGFLNIRGVDICNVKLNLDSLRTIDNPMHPNDFHKLMRFSILRFFSSLLFVLGITGFVVSSFISQEIQSNGLSKYTTLLAFATMCCGIYLTDKQRELQEKINYFHNDKLCVIELVFPGFNTIYRNDFQHKASVEQQKKIFEEKFHENFADNQYSTYRGGNDVGGE